MRHVFVMATPKVGAPLIGTASDVCTELWGSVPSGYPRHISRALHHAREGGTYRGYKWQVVQGLPLVLQRKGPALIEGSAHESQCA